MMRLPVLVVIILGVFTAADCHDFNDEHEEDPFYGDENQWLEKIPAISSDTRVSQLEEKEEQMLFDDLESDSERRVCSPTISCVLAGGQCIRRGESCDGTKDPKGCSGRRCQCCIPDVTPPTCPPPPTCAPPSTCPPTPTCPPPPQPPTCPAVTSSSIKNSILEWSFVGEDHFVRFNERMTWDEAQDFCTAFGLELYQPQNITKVVGYLADNFESDGQDRTWLGGRGNGTNVLWLSGEVVSGDEPWGSTYYTGYVSIDTCLVVSTSSSQIRDGKLLWLPPCTHIDNINYILCGESHDYTLTWHSIGEDRFARYNHMMDWDDSRSLCKTFGLDLYQPKNTTAVSVYLSDLVNGLDNPLKSDSKFWLGAKGNGTDAVWLSGEVIPSDLFYNPLYRYPYGCVFSWKIIRGKDISIWNCDQRNVYPLCG